MLFPFGKLLYFFWKTIGNCSDYALIMEDDCSFEYICYQKKTIEDLINLMNVHHNDWGILQLAMSNRGDHNIKLKNDSEYIRKGFKNCTSCYLINRKGMNDILSAPMDYGQADYYLYKNTATYYVTKPYFTYRYSKLIQSTVHNMGENSKLTAYNREDASKKFWDKYYCIVK